MLKDFLKNYLSFTRKERTGILVLSVLIAIIFLLPYLIPAKEQAINETSLKEFESQLAMLDSQKVEYADHSSASAEKNPFADYENIAKTDNSSQPELFYFDPNTVSVNGWAKLGVSQKTIKTIQNYLSKGGRFRHPEDIGKIYGMPDEKVKKLLPFVRLKRETNDTRYETANRKTFVPPYDMDQRPLPPERKPSLVIDINTADTLAFIALPGIGSKLASRIINFRSKLGGFYSVSQVSEVYGIADSTFQKIKPFLKVSSPIINTLNINTLSVNELQQHPYLRSHIAKAVVAYRLEHGDFKTISDVERIDIVTSDIFSKISPYLRIE